MKIEVSYKDRDGNELELGDTIELFDWGGDCASLGTAKIFFNETEGCIDIEPRLIEDHYDLISKALPRSRKIIG